MTPLIRDNGRRGRVQRDLSQWSWDMGRACHSPGDLGVASSRFARISDEHCDTMRSTARGEVPLEDDKVYTRRRKRSKEVVGGEWMGGRPPD